jgi:hypothetical protein
MLKYKDLQIEIERLWKTKVEIIPIIVGAKGTISKQLPEELRKIPGCDGERLLDGLQEVVILETCRIVRKTL